MVLKSEWASVSLGGLLEQWTGPTPSGSDSVGLGQGLTICLSKKFVDDGDHTLRTSLDLGYMLESSGELYQPLMPAPTPRDSVKALPSTG